MRKILKESVSFAQDDPQKLFIHLFTAAPCAFNPKGVLVFLGPSASPYTTFSQFGKYVKLTLQPSTLPQACLPFISTFILLNLF